MSTLREKAEEYIRKAQEHKKRWDSELRRGIELVNAGDLEASEVILKASVSFGQAALYLALSAKAECAAAVVDAVTQREERLRELENLALSATPPEAKPS